MDEIRSKRLLAMELAKRTHKYTPQFKDPLYTLQNDFLTNPSKLKAFFATRRTGKSYTLGKALLQTAYENPGCTCVYIALTRDSAKRIMYKDVLKPLNKQLRLGAKFNETTLTVLLPNGSMIYLMGVDSSEDEKDKLLGQKYKLAVIDEAASFSIDLRELVYGTLKPAMADLGGTIILAGTPGNITKSLFYDVTTGAEPGWHVVKATTFDNPYMAQKWQQEIDELKLNQPYITETPMFRQMYLGEWVIDEDALVYKFNEDRNWYTELPNHIKGDWQYMLGVDLGFNDDSAFVVVAYHEHDKNLYVPYTFSSSGMDFTDVANKIKEIKGRFGIHKVIVDGANKQGIEEMQKRHSLPLTIAEKHDKDTFISLMNAEFIKGTIRLSRNAAHDLANEYKGLIWKTRPDGLKRIEHPNCPNHLTDAALYAWRFCYQYASQLPKQKPVYGSKEYYEAEVDRMEQQAYDRAVEQSQVTEGVDDWEDYI